MTILNIHFSFINRLKYEQIVVSYEIYQEYLKAIDNLTIDPANRLQRKMETLTTEKSRIDRIEGKMYRK
jgi:hypothetical protein